MTTRWEFAALVLGSVLIVGGIAAVSVPAAAIFGGICFIATALLLGVEQ